LLQRCVPCFAIGLLASGGVISPATEANPALTE